MRRPSDLSTNLGNDVEWNRHTMASAQACESPECQTFYILHHQVIQAILAIEVLNLNHVLVLQHRTDACFVNEQVLEWPVVRKIWKNHLDGHTGRDARQALPAFNTGHGRRANETVSSKTLRRAIRQLAGVGWDRYSCRKVRTPSGVQRGVVLAYHTCDPVHIPSTCVRAV